MIESQRNEPFETPSHEEILAITPMHVEALESSNDDAVWVTAGMKVVLVTTIGRKSGNVHKTPVPYWLDGSGNRVIVASFAGADRNPAWYHNLADKNANPTVTVREQDEVWDSDAEVLQTPEYEEIWAQLTADRPFYIDYQAGISRRIPLIRIPKP